jgi:hypothetical protein
VGSRPLVTLGWLVAVGTRNQVRRRIARLKNPRYAAALLVGLLYFWWIATPHGMRNGAATAAGPASAALVALAPLGLAAAVFLMWIWSSPAAGLAFTPAEVRFLFPAPLARRDLIRYRLMRSQAPLLVTVALLAIVYRRGAQLDWPLRLVALWLLMTTMQWHQLTASLVRVAVRDHGAPGLRRLGVPLAVVLLVAVALGWGVVARLRAGTGGGLVAALDQPVPRLMLLPFRLAVAPIVASGTRAWAAALPGALLVLVLQYWWLLKSDTAFEEVAAETGRLQAERLAALKAGRGLKRGGKVAAATGRRLRIPLSPRGAPETAVLWKNALALLTEMRPRILVLIVGGVIATGAVSSWAGGSATKGVQAMIGVCAAFAVIATLLGPRMLATDWRRDLAKVELLKTYPLGGFSLAAAEIGAPLVGITAVQLVLLGLVAVLLPFAAVAQGELWRFYLAGLAVAAGLPVVSGMLLAVLNGFALLFPAWSAVGTDRPGGIEHMGQAILTVTGGLLVFAVSLVPPALLGGVVWLVLAGVGPLAAALTAGWVAIVALAAEVVLVVAGLGRLYDRLDPAGAGLVR